MAKKAPKNDALLKWNQSQGRVAGRKWATLRLPKGQIIAIRELAIKYGMSPSGMIEAAFNTSTEYDRAYERHLHPWAGLIDLCKGQGRFEFADKA